MAEKRLTPRQKLRAAVDRCCVAHGDAQWTHGYRTARLGCGAESEVEDERLYAKECRQWKNCGTAEQALGRAITAFARSVRK